MSYNQRNNNTNKDFRGQLKNIKKERHFESRRLPVALTTAVTDWIEDGVDHINANSCGATPIGRFLAHESSFSFVHPIYGRFASPRSFWFWLKTRERDDRLRTVTDNVAYNIFKNSTYRQVENARAIMLDADYQKLLQYPAAFDALRESTLPIDNYYYGNTVPAYPRRTTSATWQIEGWEEIRSALKEDRSPNFSKWFDVPNSGMHDFVHTRRMGEGPGTLVPAKQKKIPRTFTQNVHDRRPATSGVIDMSKHAAKTVDISADPTLKVAVHSVTLPTSQEVNDSVQEASVMTVITETPTVSEDSINTSIATLDGTAVVVDIAPVAIETLEPINIRESIERASSAETSTEDATGTSSMADALKQALATKK